MPQTKIGLDQFDKPAPLWYRRLTNAMILSFIPAYVGIIQAVPMGNSKRNILMCLATAIPFLLKGIGMIMGNGQVYQPSNEIIDKATETTKP